MSDEVFIYVPEKRSFLSISAGEYLNLSDKDLDEGYVDYVWIDVYIPAINPNDNNIMNLICINGGQYMIKKEFREYYHNEEEYIKDALDLIFDNKNLYYIDLNFKFY